MATRFERAASYWEVITLFSATCDTVKAVLERLVRSHGMQSCRCGVQVLAFADGGSTYVVRPAAECRVILASQLSCITSRVFFSTDPTFVLFEENIPMIVSEADRCGRS